MAEDKETQEKISQLQLYEQSLQNLLLQKQQFQAQANELNSALKELVETSKSYKIIGNIMVAVEKEELSKDLESKKATSELRVTTLEKQETNIREKVKALQSEVMSKMGKTDEK